MDGVLYSQVNTGAILSVTEDELGKKASIDYSGYQKVKLRDLVAPVNHIIHPSHSS